MYLELYYMKQELFQLCLKTLLLLLDGECIKYSFNAPHAVRAVFRYYKLCNNSNNSHTHANSHTHIQVHPQMLTWRF